MEAFRSCVAFLFFSRTGDGGSIDAPGLEILPHKFIGLVIHFASAAALGASSRLSLAAKSQSRSERRSLPPYPAARRAGLQSVRAQSFGETHLRWPPPK